MSGREHPTSWEYLTATNLDQTRLNELGADGWELAGIERGEFFLKRPRLSFREQVTLEQKQRYYALWNVRPNEAETGK